MSVAIPRSVPPSIVRAGKGTAGVAAVVVLWELGRTVDLIGFRAMPGMAEVIRAVVDGVGSGDLLPAVGSTLRAALTGLLIAVLTAIPTGLVTGLSRLADRNTRLLFELVRPVPSVAFIPVAIIALGLGFTTIVLVVAFACFWPILFNVKAGVEDVDSMYIETGRSIGIAGVVAVLRIVLPSALPQIATGVRLAASTALVVTITAELIIGRTGMGYYMESARLVGRVGEVWAVALMAGLLGVLLNSALLVLERRWLGWAAGNQEA